MMLQIPDWIVGLAIAGQAVGLVTLAICINERVKQGQEAAQQLQSDAQSRFPRS